MIPSFRSLDELMIITQSRYSNPIKSYKSNLLRTYKLGKIKQTDSISQDKKIVNLPKVPKIKRRKWIKSKEAVSRFFDDLDYNNQIQSSYELTLLERQINHENKDIA